MTSLKRLSLDALYFNTILRIFQQTVSAAVVFVLARCIAREGFGAVNSANIFIYFLCAVFEIKLFAPIVQNKEEPNQKILSTLFYLHLGISIFLVMLNFIGAAPVSVYFKSADVGVAVKLGSLNFIIMAFSFVQRNMLIRRLEYKKIAFCESIASIVSGVAAIWAALSGFGFLSLIIKGISFSLCATILYIVIYPWFPSLVFAGKETMPMIRFGFDVLCIEIFSYINSKISEFAAGKYISLAAAGAYSVSGRLSSVSHRKMKEIISNIIFAAFSRVQDDKNMVFYAFFKAIRVCACVNIPFLAVLAVLSPNIIMIVYGKTWESAVIPMQILCFVWMMQGFLLISDSIFLALKKAWLKAVIEGFSAILLMIMIAFSVRFSLTGLSYALLIWSLVLVFANFHFVNRLLGHSFSDYASELSSAIKFLCAFLISAAAGKILLNFLIQHSMLNYSLDSPAHVFMEGFLYSGICFVVYLFLLEQMNVDGIEDIKNYLREKLLKRFMNMKKTGVVLVGFLVLFTAGIIYIYQYTKDYKAGHCIFPERIPVYTGEFLSESAVCNDVNFDYRTISLGHPEKFGFRDDGVLENPYALVIGGASVFGRNVPLSNTFSELCEQNLGRDFINAGAEYVNALQWHKALGSYLKIPYPLSLVVYGFSLDTDVISSFDPGYLEDWYEPNPVSFYLKYAKKQTTLNNTSPLSPWHALKAFPKHPVREYELAMESVLRAITDMNNLVKSQGMQFAVIMIPAPEQVYKDELMKNSRYASKTDPELMWQYFRNKFPQNGVLCFDLTPHFRENRDKGSLYFGRSLSPLGHSIAADAIIFYMKAQGM